MFKLLPRKIRNSIRNKVFLSFLIVLLLVTAVFYTAYQNISKLGIASDNILKMNYNSILAMIQMLDAVESIESSFVAYQGKRNSTEFADIVDKQHQFSQWFGRAKDNITEEGEATVMTELDTLYGKYTILINTQLGKPMINQDDSTRLDLRDALKVKCYDLLKLNEQAMFNKSAAAQKIARQGIASLSFILIAVFLIGVILSYGLSYRIVKPIYKLLEATQKISQGDYSSSISSDSEDELGILTDKFNDMTGKLKAYNDVNLRTILAEQQKVQAIFSNIDDGILFINPDYRIMDANEQAVKIFRVKRDEMVGHHFLEIVHDDTLFGHLKHCIETRSVPAISDKDNVISSTLEDSKVYYQYFFTPLKSKRDELLGAMFLLRDITKLMELDQLKSEFVMIVSHELKTPLTSINMSIDLIRESLGDKLNPSESELLDIAKEDILRLRALIHDLLDLSKIEAGKIDLQFKGIEPADLMRSVAYHFKAQALEQDVSLEAVTAAKLPQVRADEEKLILVFSNLISNALRFVQSGGNIALKAEAAGKFVTFSVKDNGSGIPLAYQNKIFDRFIQYGDSNNAKGTGLGLTICREIVRAHGGTIWVESESGKGSEFLFTIPINEEDPYKYRKDKR